MIESTVWVNNSSIEKSWLDRFHSPGQLVKISLHTRARSIEIGTQQRSWPSPFPTTIENSIYAIRSKWIEPIEQRSSKKTLITGARFSPGAARAPGSGQKRVRDSDSVVSAPRIMANAMPFCMQRAQPRFLDRLTFRPTRSRDPVQSICESLLESVLWPR